MRQRWGDNQHAAIARIKQTIQDCSLCTTCSAPLAKGQSVTLWRQDIGEWTPHWVWTPMCQICTLMREASHQPARTDHPIIHTDYRRLRCAWCRRPLRIPLPNRGRDTCCYACQRMERARRSNVRRQVKPKVRACIVCGASFTKGRRDAQTCGNNCRQRLFRQRHAAH